MLEPDFNPDSLFDGLDVRLSDRWSSVCSDLAEVPSAVLAVSGGPDSLAMLVGLALLRKAGRISTQLEVATIDHGLRPEASEEVALARRVSELFSLPCVTLTLSPSDKDGNTQAWARDRRYSFLTDYADELGAVVLTAHTADDQAETLLMRAARGTGTEGLAGIRAATVLNGVRVRRPFLTWPREELHAVLDEVGIEPAQDPSNADPAYTRVRFRQWLENAPQPDGDRSIVEGMAETARLASQDAEALEMLADQQFQKLGGASHGYVKGILDIGALPTALLSRVLRIVMSSVSHLPQSDRHLDLARLSALAERMRIKRHGKTVMGSSCFEWETNPDGVHVLAYAEAGRDGFPVLEVEAASAGVWDNRFRVENQSNQAVFVRSFDASLGSAPKSAPMRVQKTLPVVCDEGGMVIVSAVEGFEAESGADSALSDLIQLKALH